MPLTSLNFAGFTLIALLLYYPLPRRAQNAVLLVASYAFAWSWSWWVALVLLALTALNFALGAALTRERRGLLWLGIALNVGALALLKYEDFFVPELRARLDQFGVQTGIGGLDVLLPVGMSFYIVALISYLADVYRGMLPACRDPLDFALYVAYFPKLLAGPIERARDFLPRLAAPRVVDNEALAQAFTRIVIGAVRKLVIADTLFNTFPAALWRAPERFAAPELAGYLVIYAFALYNDFAGYTSVARGVSGLFGIPLAPNFNTPYFARNFTEFWNRWHSTLSAWLRDYIFYPTSRALLRRNPRRDNLLNLILPPLLTMLVSGLWHGTGWRFVLWGGMHGLYLVGERALSLHRPALPPDRQPRWRQLLAMALVFGLVTLAWVPFRAPTLDATWQYWRGLLDWSTLYRPSARAFIALLPALWLDWVQARAGDELALRRWPRLVQAVLLALALLAIFLATQADTGAPFVYQAF